MRVFTIPKKRGGVRRIYDPNKQERALVNDGKSWLMRIAMVMDDRKVMHGFMPMRSPVTNASQHVGFQYTLSFDLQDFFDHCSLLKFAVATGMYLVVDRLVCREFTIDGEAHPRKTIASDRLAILFPDGAARQGIPTSPIIANICFAPVDKKILALLDSTCERYSYTRYADDLTISFNELTLRDRLKTEIPAMCFDAGFPVNPAKTHFQAASRGRRIITGVGVDGLGVHPTRDSKRRLRAAKHNKAGRHAAGLAEWCKCKPPNYHKWAVRTAISDSQSLEVLLFAGSEMYALA